MRYKLIFGVRDVTDKPSEREATGLESPSFYDVCGVSQIVIDISPEDLEKHIETARTNLPVLSQETLNAMRRDFVYELGKTACDTMLRGVAEKLVAHVTKDMKP